MTWRVQWCSCVVGAAVLAMVAACDAHGLVGSNVSAGVEDGVGDETTTPIGEDGSSVDPSTTGGTTGSGSTSTTGLDPLDETTSGVLFDVLFDDVPLLCLAPQSTSCDHLGDNPWRAMGINCPGAVYFETSMSGDPSAMAVHEGPLGTHSMFSPREGSRMVILSTGRASDVPRTHAELGCNPQTCPSTAFSPGSGLHTLPPPIDVRRVSNEVTCAEDSSLVGTGDCSNTLEAEFAGGVAYDYAEIRLKAQVPPDTDAFAYQFAFFSAEYPINVDESSPWNDMYIAWLESEAWTGNISFDQNGHPISIGGVFLDYHDQAPELDGFSMDGHAGTRWLQTVAPVQAGEDIEVVFAIFDMNDADLDTVVLLDNVHWSCTDVPPITQPEG